MRKWILEGLNMEQKTIYVNRDSEKQWLNFEKISFLSVGRNLLRGQMKMNGIEIWENISDGRERRRRDFWNVVYITYRSRNYATN